MNRPRTNGSQQFGVKEPFRTTPSLPIVDGGVAIVKERWMQMQMQTLS
jgi:hypothetical protein